MPACTSTLIVNSGNESGIVAKTSLISLNVKVLPNPSENYFTLTMSGIKNEPVQIKVVDMFGKVLFTAHGNANDTYRFGDQFASGAYMVEIIQATEKKTIKVVKR